MSAVHLIVVAAGIALAWVVLIAFLVIGRRSWERSTATGPMSERESGGTSPTTTLADRPADARAETMDPDRLGGDHSPPARRARPPGIDEVI